jgi:recombination associated protein RdgC
MWPKKIVLFQRGAEALVSNENLEKNRFVSPSALEWFSEGFIPVAPNSEDYRYSRNGFDILRLMRECKILPPSVIRDAVEAKAEKIEQEENRKIGRKEKLSIKEQVTDELLPGAFTKRSATNIWMLASFIAIEANQSMAESIISKLREAEPPFPCKLVKTKQAPHVVMTDWLSAGEASGNFELDSDCELKSAGEDGATVKCQRFDLTAEEIQNHIATGKQVTKLGLIWNERIRFVLSDSLQITRIKFLDVLQDEASQAGDDAESLFEATATIIGGELTTMIDHLIAAFGGIEE